ncbi:MAG: hypothetical protein GY938_27440 [Ketobacter sp.]|nr:hypothetical protein [Ketobacter sp.]
MGTILIAIGVTIGIIVALIVSTLVYSNYKAVSFMKKILESRLTMPYLLKPRSLTSGVIESHYEIVAANMSALLGTPIKNERLEMNFGGRIVENIYTEWLYSDGKKTAKLIKYSDSVRIGRVWIGDTDFAYKFKHWFHPF